MGCFNSKSSDDSKIRARYLDNNHISLNNNERENTGIQQTNNLYNNFNNDEYEEEEEESETDDSYLYDSDYYNKKARLKRKTLPFYLHPEEKKQIISFKYHRKMKGNNLPFWQLIFDYL